MRWRATRDPYRILVSEVMLQQTQVDRVRGKYAEFIRRFPDVRSLARAPLSDVLRVWSGLGYNRRARYLRDCARVVAQRFGGRFPNEREVLLGLPGIGPSTASAIRSFAFGADDPMIDTNIRRVLSRVFSRNAAKTNDRVLYELARNLIPKGRGREWNYAMLDLAATTCTARNHRDDCPFADWHGSVENAPRKPRVSFRLTSRYARGRIVAALSKNDRLTISSLEKVIGSTPYSVQEIVDGLIRDRLVRRVGKRYELSRL